jgi:PTH1 family peptidyl-tRNA hydrolase
MIKLIVGLGNPGQQYEKTRHNAGFLFLDELASELGARWIKELRFNGFVTECSLASQKILLLKPDTFMNRSGYSVGLAARYYKFEPGQILVVHDELDFAPGMVKLKKNGGHAGHNGLKDIIAHLGSAEFYRLRIGIGRPVNGGAAANFVLAPASKDEWLLIKDGFERIKNSIEQIVAGDMETAMNRLHG